MPKKQKVERDVRSIVSFQPQHLNDLSDNLAASPWPTVGDVLIRTSIGNEKWIFPLTAWEKNDLEHLSYFAMQYHEVARSLVGAWLTGGRRNPETVIYGIAFAFRHAIELTLKSLIATDESFQAKSASKKQKALHGHDLVALFAHLERPLKSIGFSADEVKPVRKLIAELQHLDDRSDGFRYPFRFESGKFELLATRLHYASADNLLYGLEAIMNWLNAVVAQRELHADYISELEEAAGPP